ncbi:Ribosomal silencing factor RsfS [Galdieria sulphuraria]|nr:Ribosomal silencing factor RsfS [Galdieria sulphuraria]
MSRTSLYFLRCIDFAYPTSREKNISCNSSSLGFSQRLIYSRSICCRRVQRRASLVAKADNGTTQNPSDMYSFPKKSASQQYLDQIWKNENLEDFSVEDEETEEEEEKEGNFLLDDEFLNLRTPSTLVTSNKEQRNSMDEWFSSSRDTFDQVGTMEEEESLPWVVTVMKAGEDRKAKDITGLWVSELTTITSFLVNMCGNNEPQIQAIARNVEGSMWNIHQQKVKRRTGTAASGWILLDYGDIIVNIMSISLRKHYNLEGLWYKAEKFTIEKIQELKKSTV